jgi:hypothetical protein
VQECEEVPRLGTAMPVVMYGLGRMAREVPMPGPGLWVKLRNVAACVVHGQLQARSTLQHGTCPVALSYPGVCRLTSAGLPLTSAVQMHG